MVAVLQHLGIVVASELFLFILPGALLVRASGAAIPLLELPAWALAGSLASLFVCFSAVVATGQPLQAALWPLLAIIVVAAVAAYRVPAGRRITHPPAGDDARAAGGDAQGANEASCGAAAASGDAGNAADVLRSGAEPRWWLLLLLVVTVAAALAASTFASVGSIDRWWYLAYVRSYLESDALRIDEPFLGTGRVFARFGVHPWLMGLALWSRLSSSDPVWLYERVAPALAVTASVSATLALARALFGYGAVARTAVIATLLTWGGSLLPVLARAGEDKILAQAALAGLCIAACLAAVRRERGALALAALAAIATATTHGLVFAFVLLAWLPFVALRGLRGLRGLRALRGARGVRELRGARGMHGVRGLRGAGERGALAATVVVLLAVAVQPAITGIAVERDLARTGAVAESRDHPVLRVHESRDRTLSAGNLGFVVHPRLLAHPLSLLALGVLPMLVWRRRDMPGDFLLTATATALIVAFVPPMPALVARVIPEWMVYRVLWILPLGPLAALGADQLRRRLQLGEATAIAMLFALGALPLLWSVEQRTSEARAARAVPASAGFAEAMRAIAALPRQALVAAAPELAERIPALAGRHVVAGLDRSTIVFSGSRDAGEARLLLRAATLAGDARAAELAIRAAVRPTHALFDPHAPAQPACVQRLFNNDRYALCLLDVTVEQDKSLPLLRTDENAGDGSHATARVASRGDDTTGCAATARDAPCTACCTPAAMGGLLAAAQPGDWDAAAPLVDCRIECAGKGAADANIVAVEIVPLLGRGVEELLLRARCLRDGNEVYVATGRARTDGGAPIRFALPQTAMGGIDAVELRVIAGLLPFLKLRGVTWDVTTAATSDNGAGSAVQ